MDRRRALLGGGKEPLYIYKPGFTAWQNIQSATPTTVSVTFNADNVTVGHQRSNNTSTLLSLLISESVYKGYKKLIIKISSSASYTQNQICWGTTAGNVASGTAYNLSTTPTEYIFDISSDTGNRYIILRIYGAMAKHTIYDIHFE
jgi:hypothetical protein